MANEISLYPLGELPTSSALSSDQQKDVRDLVYAMLRSLDGTVTYGTVSEVFRLSERGIQLGSSDFDVAPFSVTMAGLLTATGAVISGTITATAGTIGGFSIGADYIRDAANTFGLASTVTAGDDVRFWAGSAFASRATAPARIHESGAAFFTDVTVAGTIRTTVFEKDVVSAVGGQLLIANADALDDAMTALDASTLKIKGETTFAVNDILHLKDGTDEEYMRVTAIGSAPTYTVTRDLAAAYASNSNPAWAAGTAVVVEGNTDGASTKSGGYLRALGSGTNSPRYSVFKRTGFTYNGVTEYIGLGNLNGLLDYVADEYGQVIGTTTDGFLAFDPTNGLRISAAKISIAQRFTTGMDLTQGNIVAVETDGLLWRPRITASPTSVYASSVTADNADYNNGETVIVGHRETQAGSVCTLFSVFDEGNDVSYRAVIMTNKPFVVGTVSSGVLISGVATGQRSKCCSVLTTSALGAYNDSTTIKANMITGLNSGASVQAVATVSTSASHPCVFRYSDTEVLCVYLDTSTSDIVVRKLTISSGTTIAASSATTLLTGTYNAVWDIKRLGTSEYFVISFEDSSNNQKLMCFSYDGSTFTPGAELSIVSGTTGVELDLDYLTSSKLACIYKTTTNTVVDIITRSGVTLTNQNSLTVHTDGGGTASGRRAAISRLGQDSFITLYSTAVSGTAASLSASIVRSPANTPTLVGSEFNLGTNGRTDGRFLTCRKINPEAFAMVYCDTNQDYNIQVYTPTTTLRNVVGIMADTTAVSVTGGAVLSGYSDDPTGLTTGTVYYSDIDGELITLEQGGLSRFGIAFSATTMKVE